MRLAHHVQPLVGRRLRVAVEQLADAVDEDLGAAAGHAAEPGGHQPLRARRAPAAVEVCAMCRPRAAKRVQLEVRIARLHAAEQVLVPRDRQVGVVAALQQQLVAAERDRLVDLAVDLVEAEDVAVGVPDLAVERAEVAARDADVGVVDVAVDDVGDDAVGMLAARGPRRPSVRATASAPGGRGAAPRRRRGGRRPGSGRRASRESGSCEEPERPRAGGVTHLERPARRTARGRPARGRRTRS